MKEKLKLKKKRRGDAAVLVLSIALFLTGAAIFAAMITTEVRWRSFSENGVPITAYVTDIKGYSDSDGDPNYIVYIRYTYNDTDYIGKTSYYYRGMKKGSAVPLMIDPQKPEKIMTYPGAGNKILLIPGCVFAGVGAVVFIIYLKKRR